jgi:hypothetical protein
MEWKLPPVIKIYEALGCIGDRRIFIRGNTAQVTSSSGNKTYTVTYNSDVNAIMANDNGSFWQGYIGYPAIAYLFLARKLTLREKYAAALVGIPWKDINTKFKNDFGQTTEFIHHVLQEKGVVVADFLLYVNEVGKELEHLHLHMLGNKVKPPAGY